MYQQFVIMVIFLPQYVCAIYIKCMYDQFYINALLLNDSNFYHNMCMYVCMTSFISMHYCFMILIGQVFNVIYIITDICGLRPETGRCRERHIKWFYNGTTSRCERFIYGGCDGNPNKFDTQDECDSFCAEGSGEITVDIDVSGVDSCKYIFCLGECHLYILISSIKINKGVI